MTLKIEKYPLWDVLDLDVHIHNGNIMYHFVPSKLKSRMSISVPLCTQHCAHRAHPTWVCSGGRCVEAGPQVDTWEGPTMLPGLAGAKKPYFGSQFSGTDFIGPCSLEAGGPIMFLFNRLD